jgi:hypothetical protein
MDCILLQLDIIIHLSRVVRKRNSETAACILNPYILGRSKGCGNLGFPVYKFLEDS